MNEYGILTTKEEKEKADLDLYTGTLECGEFNFKVKHRAWHKSGNALIFYGVIAETNQYVRLFAWRRFINGNMLYAPKYTDIDAREIADDMEMTVKLELNSKGNVYWHSITEFIQDRKR